jgi:pyridoxamine 5'-phosphate oxidase
MAQSRLEVFAMSAVSNLSLEDALAFANQNQACWVATSLNDQPHVRGLLMWFADASGFYFHTGATKSLAEQIAKNPRVEIAFFNPGDGPGKGRMMRVTGKVERVIDAALEARLVQERAWLKDMVAASAKGTLYMFRMPHGEIRDWTMATNLHEREQVPLVF